MDIGTLIGTSATYQGNPHPKRLSHYEINYKYWKFSTTLSVAKIVPCRGGDGWMTECGAMEEWYRQGKTQEPVAVPLCPPNVTWTVPGLNQGLGGEKPVTNRLNHCKAPFLANLINPQTLLRCAGSCAYITTNLPQPHGLMALQRRRWWDKGLSEMEVEET